MPHDGHEHTHSHDTPGEIDWNVPPTTPAMPASPAPKAKTSTKTS